MENITSDDVLVLATDGLWDVVSNEEVASIVSRGLQAWDNESKAGKYRYISLAQVLYATTALIDSETIQLSSKTAALQTN